MGIKLKALALWLILAPMMAVAMFCGGAKGEDVCNMDITEFKSCRAAITGQDPPLPIKACCAVLQHGDLPCLCSFKFMMPTLGLDPNNVFALPPKCGLQTPQC
ncbi:hypothetical protein K1719_020462 [Acacia pycnantha]|nr:hypothetical protein K1719_020462 [Acacia pycnantha]